MRARGNPLLTLGSDCAGLHGGGLALEALGVQHSTSFLSEKDPAARRVLEANFDFEWLQEDCMTRDVAATPSVDLYTAGFPCVPYSCAGLGGGLASADGLVGLACIRYIARKRPGMFLLENVSNLVSTRHMDAFNSMLSLLSSIQDHRFVCVFRAAVATVMLPCANPTITTGPAHRGASVPHGVQVAQQPRLRSRPTKSTACLHRGAVEHAAQL